jgi:hypothetical protein
MRDLSKRVATLEAGTLGAVTVRDAIDRPPRETRDEWIARQAGLPPPHPPRQLVADFLYRWEDTGRDPSRTARELLEILVNAEGFDEAMRQISSGLY